MPVPNPFWDPEDNLNPPLTDAAIAEAETLLGVKLPAALLDLLRIQNGGFTQGFAFPVATPTSWAANHVPLPELFGIVTDEGVETEGNLLDTLYLGEEDGLPGGLVLLSGDGDWYLALDYRRREVPTVSWIDVVNGEDLVLADSFEAFVEGLVPEGDFER